MYPSLFVSLCGWFCALLVIWMDEVMMDTPHTLFRSVSLSLCWKQNSDDVYVYVARNGYV